MALTSFVIQPLDGVSGQLMVFTFSGILYHKSSQHLLGGLFVWNYFFIKIDTLDFFYKIQNNKTSFET
jgi:hypothetical protein